MSIPTGSGAKSMSVARRFFRSLLFLTAFVLTIILVHTIVSSWAERRFITYLHSIRDAGYKITLREQLPPKPDADGNGAPYFLAAFQLIFPEEGLMIQEDSPLRDCDPSGRESIIRILEKNRDAFDLVRRGRSKSFCRYDRSAHDYEIDPSRIPSFRETTPSTELSRLLSWRAQVEAAAGRGPEARECIRDIYALAECFKDDPLFDSQHTRLQITTIGTRALGLCLEELPSPEELTRWTEILPSENDLDGLTEKVLRAQFAYIIKAACDPWRGLMLDDHPDWLFKKMFPHLDFLYRVNSIGSIEEMRRLIELCREPYPECGARVRKVRHNIDDEISNPFDVGEILLPTMGFHLLDRQVVTQAYLVVTRTGMEHELHRLTHGEYPGTVSVTDPCTGRPLLYDPAGRSIRSQVPKEAKRYSLEPEDLSWKLRNP